MVVARGKLQQSGPQAIAGQGIGWRLPEDPGHRFHRQGGFCPEHSAKVSGIAHDQLVGFKLQNIRAQLAAGCEQDLWSRFYIAPTSPANQLRRWHDPELVAAFPLQILLWVDARERRSKR